MIRKKIGVEQFRKKVSSLKEKKLREEERNVKKAEQEKRERDNELHASFPPAVLTILKRLKRIDPWEGVVNMNPWDCALTVFYKMRQSGMVDLRIKSTISHAWVEFRHTGNWYIFDPKAIQNTEYGEPVQQVGNSTDQYSSLGKSYDKAADFYESHEDKFEITQDMARIAAMEDYGLNTVLKMNYY